VVHILNKSQASYTIQLGDEICQMEHLNHGEMAVVLREQLLLFVRSRLTDLPRAICGIRAGSL